MRRTPRRRLLAATLFVASLLVPTAVAPAMAVPAGTAHPSARRHCPPGGLGPGVTARLDRTIEDVRRQAGIPGAVVGLWMPGKGCYVRASGVADKATGRPMTPGVYERIGSETKTFTATALLQLVDDHRVRLDDPVSRYVHGVPDGDRITLRHLAEMRSGLFPYSSDPDFVRDLLSDPERSFTPRQLLAYAFKHKNTFAPGTQFQYSNTNFIVLGLVVEKVSGQRLADFVDARILRPARLHHTLLPRGTEFPRPHPHGYTDQTLTGEVADATHWNPSWAWAAGAMISDLQDLRRWAEVVATGSLLSPRTQAQRLRMLPTGVAGLSYGLGLFDANGWIGHNGSIPGYETVTVYLPAQRVTLVIMINTDSTVQGQEPSTLLAQAVTAIVTPDHVYGGAVATR
ncbi:serine hydrolase domain-containing protein [Streptomyces gilvus]|uniref:serine hydrolase domain-containing protein n=1 Tax=Streptomyces gilvus TaxID=2920937 RepID=UPI001F10E5FC|nr:beta-lactamase family protein [Streptomyces sp. CME 23]MCH5671262.1 beta-lactamase family protein [Streptomyces sp. CME 23]